MSEFILRTVDSRGTSVKESNIKLNEGSILIHFTPPQTTIAEISEYHKNLVSQLENKSPVITLMDGSSLQVLEVNEKFDWTKTPSLDYKINFDC